MNIAEKTELRDSLSRIEDKCDFLIAHLIAGRLNPLGCYGGIPRGVAIPQPRIGHVKGYEAKESGLAYPQRLSDWSSVLEHKSGKGRSK